MIDGSITQLEEIKISTFDAAYRRMLKYLMKRGFIIIHVYPINKNRYIIVKGLNRTILITYKREPFHNFGHQLKEHGSTELGDTVNTEDIKNAIQKGTKDIYTIFSNGEAYTITMQNFLEKSIEWENSEGKQVRSVSLKEYKLEAEIWKLEQYFYSWW